METNKINLLVYDTEENFEKTKSQLGYEDVTFKRLIVVEDITQLDRYIKNQLNDDDLVFLVVHVFAMDKIKGIKQFMASGIAEKYPKFNIMYISDGASDTNIQKEMVDNRMEVRPIFRYHQVLSELKTNKFEVFTKKELLESKYSSSNTDSPTEMQKANEYPTCKYAIITALEEAEMEKILPMLTKIKRVENDKHLIEYGYLTSNSQKTVVYASQLATGMIDSAILATEIIIKFKPKFLIMAGVLGGRPNEVNIGDVAVATKVIAIDKGKISEVGFKPETELSNTDNAYITAIKRNKERIINYIKEQDQTRDKRINVHFGPIFCVRQVIDLEGFFEEKLTPIDRKGIALEMESYGVSRACELVNDGKTLALIIKSAMDNTVDKDDHAKPWAAWTSAMTIKYILENDILV